MKNKGIKKTKKSVLPDLSQNFVDLNEDRDDADSELKDTRKLVAQQNRKNKKSGGFQSMGLSHATFTGIIRKGYKIPTPIQRKTIPIILEGKDVVAMARTGSGKTAAFLIPLFEKLKQHETKGARALIMSPTRELALQTLKFTKELGRYSGLKAAVILGGDRMDDQFSALHENPDIIIATPGRFLHVVMEMDLKLQSVEYVVFDEADRLFELGFMEQLNEVLQRLPESRQTLLFSATLPKLLVDFAKAGLHDPTLLRLDVETKLSENLQLSFIECRNTDKSALLLHILRDVIEPRAQTVIFAATKHHVEYLNMLLVAAGIKAAPIYSSLDATARKINLAKFQHKKCAALIVTDLAARGIDIPMLDNVINYNFPAKAKLFVHRVGRVARAGRSGTAYSLVTADELPYVLDLHLFLGRPMKYATKESECKKFKFGLVYDDGLYGRVPQVLIDQEDENIVKWLENSSDLESQLKVCDNGYKNYIKSRPPASTESIKRVKEMKDVQLSFHPMFRNFDSKKEEIRTNLLESVKNYKPSTTIFEVNATAKTSAADVMRKQRNMYNNKIERNKIVRAEKQEKFINETSKSSHDNKIENNEEEIPSESAIQDAFSRVVIPKRLNPDSYYEPKKKKRKTHQKDEEFYIPYQPKDYNSEKGLNIGTSFEQQAAGAILDLTGDEDKNMRKMQNSVKWDRKKKKFVGAKEDPSKKKIKTESGVWINASYKKDIYKTWLEKSKVNDRDDDSDEDKEKKPKKKGPNRGIEVLGHSMSGRKGFHQTREKFKGPRNELLKKEHIVKQRKKKAKKFFLQKKRQITKSKSKSRPTNRKK